MSEDPSKWDLECLQQCLLKLGQSTSGTKELIDKRIIKLKNLPMLDKIVQKRKTSCRFKSRLLVQEIPPPEAACIADLSHYSKVILSKQVILMFYEKQGSLAWSKITLFFASNLQTVNQHVSKSGCSICVLLLF